MKAFFAKYWASLSEPQQVALRFLLLVLLYIASLAWDYLEKSLT